MLSVLFLLVFLSESSTCSNGVITPPGYEFFFGFEKAYKDMDTALNQSDGVALCEANEATISDLTTEDEYKSMLFIHGKKNGKCRYVH